MLRDITIGQHFPGNSLVHRFDPRLKLVLTVAYIVLLFAASNPLGLTLSILFLGVISIQYPEGNCVTETSCTPLTSKNAAVGCSITEMSTLAVAPPPNLLNVYYKPYS